MTLGDMLATPGIYLLNIFEGLLFIEVMDDGTCHQLKFDTLEPDGILSRDGWSAPMSSKVIATGPLQRKLPPMSERFISSGPNAGRVKKS